MRPHLDVDSLLVLDASYGTKPVVFIPPRVRRKAAAFGIHLDPEIWIDSEYLPEPKRKGNSRCP